MQEPPSSMSHVCVYGVALHTDLDIVAPLPRASDRPDLHVIARAEPISIEAASLLYSGPAVESGGAPNSGLYRQGDVFIFHFADAVDFCVQPDRITYYLRDPFFAYGIEIWLLGTVLAFWLEWNGRPALHASAVATGQGAVGFMASNRGGKSSLAAACMQQGLPLLTDDLLVLGTDGKADRSGDENLGSPVHARPGYPQMRMWPGQAARFALDPASLESVHPYIDKKRVPVGGSGLGTFCDEPRPVRALYLPDRRDNVDGVDIRPVSPGEAVIELIRGSFVAPLIEAAGWQPRRLPVLSHVAESVPMRRLIYPNGTEYLPDVVNEVHRDVQNLRT